MNSSESYLRVLREFALTVSGQETDLDMDTELSFEHDGLLAFLFQHPTEDAVVIDVEITALREPLAEPSNLERLLLLHQLNSVTRFTHGASAFVSVDQMLMVSRTIAVQGLGGQALADALSELLDAAASLRQAWDDLRALIAEAGRAVELQTATHAQPLPGQFA